MIASKENLGGGDELLGHAIDLLVLLHTGWEHISSEHDKATLERPIGLMCSVCDQILMFPVKGPVPRPPGLKCPECAFLLGVACAWRFGKLGAAHA